MPDEWAGHRITVASERQIAANRRNALKSIGPRTNAGKQRAAKNARRHGLSIQTDEGVNAQAIEFLARSIVEGIKVSQTNVFFSAPELLRTLT